MQIRILIRKNRAHRLLFDDVDLPLYNAHTWWAMRIGRQNYLTVSTKVSINGRRYTRYFHRQIAGLIPGDPHVVDHINHDTFDNRRRNLRVVTRADNNLNNRGKASRRSEQAGVYFDNRNKQWKADVTTRGVRISRGFKTEAEAAVFARTLREARLKTITTIGGN